MIAKEATTEINWDTSTNMNKVENTNIDYNLGGSLSDIGIRKKRDLNSINDFGETIIEEAMDISESTLDDPNASSRETKRAEDLFVYSKDLIENLEAIDKSDINDKEKIEIEDKLEG